MTGPKDEIRIASDPRLTLRSRNDLIYEVVRDRICLGEYTEGFVIHEVGLANEFRVSRTPIRQALQRLVHEQFAETRNGVGTIVSAENPDLTESWKFWIGLNELVAENISLSIPKDLDSEFARLEALAGQLSADKNVHSAWKIWQGIHEARLHLTNDDMIRQVTDLMFYRTARRWCRWWTEKPAELERLVIQELSGSRLDIENADARRLYRRHGETLSALLSLQAVGTE